MRYCTEFSVHSGSPVLSLDCSRQSSVRPHQRLTRLLFEAPLTREPLLCFLSFKYGRHSRLYKLVPKSTPYSIVLDKVYKKSFYFRCALLAIVLLQSIMDSPAGNTPEPTLSEVMALVQLVAIKVTAIDDLTAKVTSLESELRGLNRQEEGSAASGQQVENTPGQRVPGPRATPVGPGTFHKLYSPTARSNSYTQTSKH